jgi:tetratricopeptide (TPR) repeat protein
MKQILLICAAMVVLSCAKKEPEREANVPDANPPAQPPVKEPKKAPAKPKVEPTEVTFTPGMEAALKAHEAGNYQEAVRLYTVELAAEEAKLAPSWLELSYLHNELGGTLYLAGLYDKAMGHHRKALAIRLKQLGPEHPHVVMSYYNIAYVYKAKKDLAKAKEYWEKAYAICLKILGPNHPYTKGTKGELDALKE